MSSFMAYVHTYILFQDLVHVCVYIYVHIRTYVFSFCAYVLYMYIHAYVCTVRMYVNCIAHIRTYVHMYVYYISFAHTHTMQTYRDVTLFAYCMFRGSLYRQLGQYNKAQSDFHTAVHKCGGDRDHPMFKLAMKQLALTYNDVAVAHFRYSLHIVWCRW